MIKNGAGKQERKQKEYPGENVVRGQSGCCGGEWAVDAGGNVEVKGAIWEAWAEDEYGEDRGDVGQAAEKINEYQVRGEGDQAGK